MNKNAWKYLAAFTFIVFAFIVGYLSLQESEEEDLPVVTVIDKKEEEVEMVENVQYPFSVEATIVRYYYSKSDSVDRQENSLVYFEGIYRPNQGVDFSYNNQEFEVVSSLSGKVATKTNDPIFGNMITIESDNGISITYSSLNEVSVAAGDEVKQGQKLGTSGTNVYESDLGNHLHVVIEQNGVLLNPETCFGKKVDEFK